MFKAGESGMLQKGFRQIHQAGYTTALRWYGVVLLFMALLPYCAMPAYAWTDDPLDPGITPLRVVHVTELRDAVDDKRYNFGFSSGAWTDSTLTAGSSLIRKVHMDELRDKLDDVNAVYSPVCPSTVPAAPAWEAITEGVTLVRAAHFTQLRSTVSAMGTARICCGACRKGSGAAGCTDQTTAQDLWSECTANNCVSGANCNGAGSCTPTASQDPNSYCAGLSCAGYYNGWASEICYLKANVDAATHVCDGAGACKAAAAQCPSMGQGASTGVDCGQVCESEVGCTGTTAGSCGNPGDDALCGTIACSARYGISTKYCYDRADITAARCEGVNDCKDADTADCDGQALDTLKYTCATCKTFDGGACTGGTLGACATDQTTAQDLWNDCTANNCVSGANCNGAGSCMPTSSQDPNNTCGDLSCASYYNGWVSEICYLKADVSAANHNCDGAGACRTAAADCPSQGQGASSGVDCGQVCESEVGCTGTTAGSCGNPGDDANCGTIDCSGWYSRTSKYCVNYENIVSARCEGVNDCKDANTADCEEGGYESTQYTCGTCKDFDSGACTGTTLGACATNQTTAQDLWSECTANNCVSGANCNGAGSCTPTASQDPNSYCAGLSCAGYYWGWASDICYLRADVSAATHVCDGAGACKTAAAQCPSQGQGAIYNDCSGPCSSTAGSCTGTTSGGCYNPGDDTLCGTIDCSARYGISTKYCYDRANITTARCEALNDCKDANTADCDGQALDTLKYTCGTCKTFDGGACTGGTLGACATNQSAAEDLWGNCTADACMSGENCNGSGSCMPLAGTDPNNECMFVSCAGYYYGWISQICYAAANADAACDGSGGCQTLAEACASSQGVSTGVNCGQVCESEVGCTGTTAGSCGNPGDDALCGTIDCSARYGISTKYCYDRANITSNRCEGVNNCKDANTIDCDPQALDTLKYTCGTCKTFDAGACEFGTLGACNTNQTTAQDLWNQCTANACVSGANCNGSGACMPLAGQDPNNYCAATACMTGYCNGAGACQYAASGTDPNSYCAVTSCKYGYCDGAGACALVPDNTECNGPLYTCQNGICEFTG